MLENPGNSFWAFLRAFGADWLTGMSGSATVPLAFVAMYVPKAPSKILFGCLAIGCVLLSSYRVWRGERISTKEQIASLRAENERLRIKPYDNEHRRLAEGKVQRLTETERDLLRFLLHHGRTEASRLQEKCRDHQTEFSRALSDAEREGLVSKSEERKPDRASVDLYWEINPQFVSVLRDILPPAGQTGTPHFAF